MLENLQGIDTTLFCWVNSHHCTVMDWVMWTFSQHWWWAVVLVAFFGLVTLRQEPKKWWLVLAAAVLCFLLADQGAVLIKNTVCRPRPCYTLSDVTMFRTHCGGQYGFVSSHASNSFALLTLLWLRYRRHTLAVILMALWAVTTCYSRIYLGKHYPGDIICGAAYGIIVGQVVYATMTMIEKKMKKSETK